MLDRIEYLAHLSVGRACGFAVLGLLTFFVGLSADMRLAFKAGGLLALLTCLILLLKAHWAVRKPYKQTEVWIMLKPAERPAPTIAQQIIGTVLRETFLHFALQAALVAAMMLLMALLLTALGR